MANTDMLGALLSDPAALQNALSMVSGVLGGAPTAPVRTPDSLATTDVPIADSPLQEGAPTAPPRLPLTTNYDPTTDMMNRAMPMVQRIMASGQDAIDPQKKELLGAIKPFLGEAAALQIDHGMRLVVLARMAYAVMRPEEENNV